MIRKLLEKKVFGPCSTRNLIWKAVISYNVLLRLVRRDNSSFTNVRRLVLSAVVRSSRN